MEGSLSDGYFETRHGNEMNEIGTLFHISITMYIKAIHVGASCINQGCSYACGMDHWPLKTKIVLLSSGGRGHSYSVWNYFLHKHDKDEIISYFSEKAPLILTNKAFDT